MACDPIQGCFNWQREVFRAPDVLPALGAFTTEPLFTFPNGLKQITFWVTYTRGLAGGFPAFRIHWGNGTEDARELLLDESTIVIAQPDITVKEYLADVELPAPSDDDPLVYEIDWTIPGGATQVALQMAERGQTGTPGTLGIAMTGSGGC